MAKQITCKDEESRSLCRKANIALDCILKKYPKGLADIDSEEKVAYFQVKIQQFRECLTNVHFSHNPKSSFIWWDNVRFVRIKSAHQIEDFSKEELSSIADYFFKNISTIQGDLKKAINGTSLAGKIVNTVKRTFENFASPIFGSREERSQLVDSMADMANHVDPEELKIDVPDNKYANLAGDALKAVLDYGGAAHYVRTHKGVSENIQTDILEWIQGVQHKVAMHDPFVKEFEFIEELKKKASSSVAEGFSKIVHNYKQLPSVSASKRESIAESTVDFKFYENEFGKLDSQKKDYAQKAEILYRNLVKDMELSLFERKNAWEMVQIELSRQQFLKELYEKIEKFKQLEKLLSPFIKDLGRLWDLSTGCFQSSGFEILKDFADLLENDESLKELAEVLGKQSREQSLYEKELRDKVVVKTEWKSRPAYRGEICGVTYSNDISTVLPSELALLRNPSTKRLFQLKFASKQLLSFKYKNRIPEKHQVHEQEEVSIEKKEPKGPILVCVDTSGSMHGAPERIAKTVTFALSKIAIQEKRKCYLVSFSTGIETLDLSDFTSVDPIQKLVGFLRMSFNGGTDAEPALRHSLKLLSENDWKNADVLMVSDFVMPGLNDDVRGLIEAEKERNTCFYSLVIGSSGNRNTIESFNHNWAYDTADPHAQRHLVQQLHELKMRKNVT